jgi:DNA/RNA-binding protein KIN17
MQREKQNRRDYWLHKDIIVKIITNKLGEKYLNKKGIVMAVKDSYIGIVKLVDSDTILKCDQSHLETVLPAIGKKVLVVNGAYRGLEAVLEDIDSETFTAKISISSVSLVLFLLVFNVDLLILILFKGPLKGRIQNNIQYEDICKLYIE